MLVVRIKYTDADLLLYRGDPIA